MSQGTGDVQGGGTQPTSWQMIRGGFAKIGRALKRAKNDALKDLDTRCNSIGNATQSELKAFLEKPKVMKLKLHISSVGGIVKDIAADTREFGLSKLGVKKGVEERRDALNARFEKLEEGLAKAIKKSANDPTAISKLNDQLKEITDARREAFAAYGPWKSRSAEYEAINAKYKELIHETNLAEQNVRIAKDNFNEAHAAWEAEKAPSKKARLEEKMKKADEDADRAVTAYKECLRKEDQASLHVSEARQIAENVKDGGLDPKMNTFEAVLSRVANETKIDTRPTTEKVKTEMGAQMTAGAKRAKGLGAAATQVTGAAGRQAAQISGKALKGAGNLLTEAAKKIKGDSKAGISPQFYCSGIRDHLVFFTTDIEAGKKVDRALNEFENDRSLESFRNLKESIQNLPQETGYEKSAMVEINELKSQISRLMIKNAVTDLKNNKKEAKEVTKAVDAFMKEPTEDNFKKLEEAVRKLKPDVSPKGQEAKDYIELCLSIFSQMKQ